MADKIINHRREVARLQSLVADLLETIDCLEQGSESVASDAAPGRKAQVLAILKRRGHVSIPEIARELGISDRNVSSQLTYLRRDGYGIGTDSKGRKFLES